MGTLLGVAAPMTTFMLMTAIGLDLTGEDFLRLRRRRALVLVGLLAPWFLLPIIALGLTRLLQSPPDIAAGVLLISACPIGSVSNTFCYLARASPALSITLTGLSSLFAAVAMPLAGIGFEAILSRPFSLRVPFGLLVMQLTVVLALPVILGMVIRGRAPSVAVRLGPHLQQWSVMGIMIVLALVVLEDTGAFLGELSATLPLAVAFVAASIGAGWVTAMAVTADARERFVLATEFGARSVGVATAVAITILGRVEFARFVAAYAVVEVPLMLAAVALFRWSRHLRASRSHAPTPVYRP
jgi:BASS family bile acid:Na+ symporter